MMVPESWVERAGWLGFAIGAVVTAITLILYYQYVVIPQCVQELIPACQEQ